MHLINICYVNGAPGSINSVSYALWGTLNMVFPFICRAISWSNESNSAWAMMELRLRVFKYHLHDIKIRSSYIDVRTLSAAKLRTAYIFLCWELRTGWKAHGKVKKWEDIIWMSHTSWNDLKTQHGKRILTPWSVSNPNWILSCILIDTHIIINYPLPHHA